MARVESACKKLQSKTVKNSQPYTKTITIQAKIRSLMVKKEVNNMPNIRENELLLMRIDISR